MNVFGIGLPEIVLIMVIALLIFGPKKLPEISRSLGKALRSFQDASKEFEAEFKQEAQRLEQAINEEPLEATLEPPAVQESLKLSQAKDNPETLGEAGADPLVSDVKGRTVS
jgi:sec-independent protein translocase protein TatA